MKKAMSLVRFEQIKRFFHLADSSHEPRRGTNDFDPLYKVCPWLSALLSNSQEMFKPGQNVSIDEMDVSFKGWSAYKSRIKFKRAGDGFLNYALCDPECGYTWAFYFQFDTRIPQEPGLSKTFNAVYQLMGQLPGDGHHVFQTIQGSRASVTPQRDCVLCKEQGKRSRSNYECSACNVGLHPGCFAEWHQP